MNQLGLFAPKAEISDWVRGRDGIYRKTYRVLHHLWEGVVEPYTTERGRRYFRGKVYYSDPMADRMTRPVSGRERNYKRLIPRVEEQIRMPFAAELTLAGLKVRCVDCDQPADQTLAGRVEYASFGQWRCSDHMQWPL